MSAVALAVAAVGAITYGATADAGPVDTPWTAPAWSGVIDYKPSDMVNNGGSKFWAIKAVPAGTATSNTTYWQPVTTVYYIDADNGLDSYNGLSQYPGYITNTDGSQGTANAAYGPWQTLEKASYKITVGYWDTVAANGNTYPLNHAPWVPAQAGNMFLFKRGTTAKYIGQLQVSAWNTALGTGIGDFLFGAYGTGSRPIIEHNVLSARYNIDRGVVWMNCTGTKLRNLDLRGLYGDGRAKTTGISLNSANQSLVNCKVSGIGGDGLLIAATTGTYAYLKNSEFHQCGLGGHPGNGIAGGCTGALLENLTVSYCGVDDVFSHGIYLANWDESTVRYCKIFRSSNFGINSGAYGNNPTIEYNLIYENRNGIDMGTSNNTLPEYYGGTMTIRGNIIHSNGVVQGSQGFGIYTINSTTSAYIINNLIYGNLSDGITVDRTSYVGAQQDTSNINIWNNTLVLSANANVVGIRFAKVITASSVKNNLIQSASTTAIPIKTDSGMDVAQLSLLSNRYYVPNKANPLEVASINGVIKTLANMQTDGYETGSTTGDPLFVGSGSDPYALQAGSALKSAGLLLGLPLDVIRNARSATTPSIGAYE